jgi:UDP-glucose 4-epimerase
MAIQLVTGGAGFIGSHIATGLVERGKSVRVFDNLSTGKPSNISHLEGKIEFVKADLLDRSAVLNALKDVEVIYHQAALASVPASVARPLDSHNHCVTGTVNLLDVARQSGVRRVVFAGSSSVYGDQPFSSKREVDLTSPMSPYAAAKVACEAYCLAFAATYGLETVVLRYFDAENVAGRVFNAACGRQFTLLALIDSINQILGKEIKPLFADPRPGDVRESLADITTAEEVLGYSPNVEFEEGLKQSIEYYKSVTARE